MTKRAGIILGVLLGSLAFSRPAEANSCTANVIVPTNMLSTVCGTILAEAVPFTVGTSTGTVHLTDQATLGELHALTVASVSSSTTLSGFCCAVGQIGVNTNGDSFTFTDLVVSGPAGTIGTSVNLSINIAISGALSSPVSGQNMGAQSGVVIGYSLPGTAFASGSLGSTNGVYSSSGFSLGVPTSAGVLNDTFQTVTVPVIVGTPFTFTLGLQEISSVGCFTGTFPDPFCGGSATATSDFANTIGFPTTGPVANLPTGYTLNSASGLIMNNQFTPPTAPIPEPSTLLLLGTGLLSMVGAARRKWLT